MAHVRATRTYRFSASHRLHVVGLSEEENDRIYGRCNNPHGHGHNYTLWVTVAGEVDERTGLVVPPAALDELVRREVVDVYDDKYLNFDVPEFERLVSTTENLAVRIEDRLRAAWPAEFPALAHIRVQETKRNAVELPVILEVV
jgi:6-pyruvoyltetrahydropterin/6-carboxytetrahydropterin synthase